MNLATKIAISASATLLTAFQAYVSYVLVGRVTELEKSRAMVCVLDQDYEPINAPENLAACVRDDRGRALILGRAKPKKIAPEPAPEPIVAAKKEEPKKPPKPTPVPPSEPVPVEAKP